MKSILRYFRAFSKLQLTLIFVFLLLGVFLRIVWGPQRIIWGYDQARDSFLTRGFVTNRHIPLLGPQAERFGLFHGPLYYYIISPFYALSHGTTEIPILVMNILTFLSVIPLSLVTFKITKNKWAFVSVLAIFSLSYQFIEYARWLSNVSVALPFISLSYLLLYLIFENTNPKKTLFFLLGVALGLASQGELFLLSLSGVFFVSFVIKKYKISSIFIFLLGNALGIIPILIAQFKFNFMGVNIFKDIFTNGYRGNIETSAKAFDGYLTHVGMTTYQTIGGLSEPMGLFVFISLIIFSVVYFRKISKNSSALYWLVVILVSHALLFTFQYVDSFFVDIGLIPLLIVLTGITIIFVFKTNRILFIFLCLLFFIFQISSYKTYIVGRKPFNDYMFVQPTSTLSHLEDIVAETYRLSGGKEFTFDAIGTPYGVRTVWASAFELYSNEHSVPLPKWYGYYANGYPGDNVLVPTNKPGSVHILVLESNIDILLPSTITNQEIGNQNNHTKIVSMEKINGTEIQLRTFTK